VWGRVKKGLVGEGVNLGGGVEKGALGRGEVRGVLEGALLRVGVGVGGGIGGGFRVRTCREVGGG